MSTRGKYDHFWTLLESLSRLQRFAGWETVIMIVIVSLSLDLSGKSIEKHVLFCFLGVVMVLRQSPSFGFK